MIKSAKYINFKKTVAISRNKLARPMKYLLTALMIFREQLICLNQAAYKIFILLVTLLAVKSQYII